MKNKFYLFLSFFLLINYSSFSQIRSFTPEPEKFLKEIQNCIAENDKSKAKAFVKSFAKTVPQIFYKEQLIGGYQELIEYLD